MRFLNTKNTAFFSTCNDAYIPYSVTSLLSIRKQIPKAKLFILSRSITAEHKRILDGLNIGYFDLDLRGKFYRHWIYPYECYYIFAGPELFFKHGFKYSVYIDGDILCLSNPLKNVGRITGVAGTGAGSCRGVFLDDFDKLKTLYNLSNEQTSQTRITSGVVYFNNKLMFEKKLLDTSANYFKKCLDNSVPRKGDDSIFSLFQLIDLEPKQIKILGKAFNYMPVLFGKELPSKIVFIHFIEYKPWNSFIKENSAIQEYIQEWLKIYKAHFSAHKIQKAILQKPITYTKKPPIKVFVSEDSHLGIKNFGDEFPKDLIPAIFHRRIIPQSNVKNVDLLSVGSVLFELPNIQSHKKVYCWGSGFISNESIENEIENQKKVNFVAVRGKYTLTRIKSAQNKPIPLGDPGILANLVYPASPQKLHKVGVVPHYIDANHPIVEKLRQDKRFFIIDPLDPPALVANQISSCDFILSSSLHGLIFADSYGIPNAHVNFSDKVYGGEYKFKDYDSGVKKHHLDANLSKIFSTSYLEELKSQYSPIKNLKKIQQELIDAFPFK